MANGWTPERRAQQSIAIRQWRPWQTTKGPATPEGKAKVAQNGFKGGPRATLKQARIIAALAEQDALALALATHGTP